VEDPDDFALVSMLPLASISTLFLVDGRLGGAARELSIRFTVY
jgi:hypothetical protein